MELVKPVEPVLWACIVELVMGGTGYGTVKALPPTTPGSSRASCSPAAYGNPAAAVGYISKRQPPNS